MFTWKHINRTASNIQLSSCTWNSSEKLGVFLPPSFINATPSKTDHHQHDINATPSKTDHHQNDTNATPSKTDHHQHEKLGNFQTPKCYFCDNSWRLVKDVDCNTCEKKGHFATVCTSNPQNSQSQQTVGSMHFPFLATMLLLLLLLYKNQSIFRN